MLLLAYESCFIMLPDFTFGNYLLKHLFQDYNNSQKKGLMRKHGNQLQKSIRQNKYDQFTNLGIDLESTLNKSVILPKIVNKIAEIQATEYMRQRKAKEDREMFLIKDQIDRLRKRIHHLDDKKIVHRLKTEDMETFHQQNPRAQRYKKSFYMETNENIRNSTEIGTISRFQRNTDKDSLRRQETSSICLNKSQVKLTSSILQVQQKPKRVSLSKGKDEKNTLQLPDQGKIKNKRNAKITGKLKKKFRVAAFAVYFSLFLPAYAKRHYQNRLKLLIQEYPHQIQKYSKKRSQVTSSKYKIDEAKLWNYFDEKLNVFDAIQKNNLSSFLNHGQQVKMIKDHFQFLINNELNSSQKSFKEQHTIIQQIMFPKNTQYLLQGFQTILTKFVDNFTSFINKSDFFLQRWKTFSLGIINNSFIHNSHPKLPSRVIQSGIVRLHPFKQIILIYDQQTECMLLGYDIMCRIFAYKWMVKLQKMKDQTQNSQEVRTIASFMVTLLYLIWENVLNQHLQTFIDENGECQRSVLKRNKHIRPIVPLIVKSDLRRDEKLLKTDKLISNPPYENEAAQVIQNNEAFVLTLKTKLKSIGYAIFQKLRIKVNQQNALTKAQTLAEKNIFDNDSNPKPKKQIISKRENKQNDEQSSKCSLSIQKRLRIKRQ